jgi:hypothetical protein
MGLLMDPELKEHPNAEEISREKSRYNLALRDFFTDIGLGNLSAIASGIAYSTGRVLHSNITEPILEYSLAYPLYSASAIFAGFTAYLALNATNTMDRFRNGDEFSQPEPPLESNSYESLALREIRNIKRFTLPGLIALIGGAELVSSKISTELGNAGLVAGGLLVFQQIIRSIKGLDTERSNPVSNEPEEKRVKFKNWFEEKPEEKIIDPYNESNEYRKTVMRLGEQRVLFKTSLLISSLIYSGNEWFNSISTNIKDSSADAVLKFLTASGLSIAFWNALASKTTLIDFRNNFGTEPRQNSLSTEMWENHLIYQNRDNKVLLALMGINIALPQVYKFSGLNPSAGLIAAVLSLGALTYTMTHLIRTSGVFVKNETELVKATEAERTSLKQKIYRGKKKEDNTLQN